MFPFSQSITPAVQDHMKSQFSLFTEMSQKMFDSVQKVNELNIQVAKTVMEESLQSTQQVLSARDPLEALSVVTGQVQPNTEKLRAYQQHLTNIAAGTQVELAKTAESRIPETTRTATGVVDEVARQASEETQKATERQKAAMEKVTNPIKASPTAPKGAATGAQHGTH